jgi:putative transposase
VYLNRIVGYPIDSRMQARLAVSALDNAVARRGDVAGCILHPEQGQSVTRTEAPPGSGPPRDGRLDGPIGSAGNNAAMESFVAWLQKNVLDRRRWATPVKVRIASSRIERTYNRRRRQAVLGRLTPIDFETIMATPATQAA